MSCRSSGCSSARACSTFVVVGGAVWLPAGRRAVTAAREASHVSDPAAAAAAAEAAMHAEKGS